MTNNRKQKRTVKQIERPWHIPGPGETVPVEDYELQEGDLVYVAQIAKFRFRLYVASRDPHRTNGKGYSVFRGWLGDTDGEPAHALGAGVVKRDDYGNVAVELIDHDDPRAVELKDRCRIERN